MGTVDASGEGRAFNGEEIARLKRFTEQQVPLHAHTHPPAHLPEWQQMPASLLQVLHDWTWRQGNQAVGDMPRDLDFLDLFAGVGRCHEYSSWMYNTFSLKYDKLYYQGQKFMDFRSIVGFSHSLILLV